MNVLLLDFQEEYVSSYLDKMIKAKRYVNDGENQAVLLSAPTGSGKTVMMTSVIETIFYGMDGFDAEKDAVVIWLSDQPELNQQSRKRILQCSSLLNESHLITIDSSFDQEVFDGGKVYFLNTQKLGKDKNLTVVGDSRSHNIWDTIQNTFEALGDKFYLIIDEAHRGMRNSIVDDNQSKTIIQKFVLGSSDFKPVPLVLGISATPQRFEKNLEGSDRHCFKVVVDPAQVRMSGLLKDELHVTINEGDGPSDWTLLEQSINCFLDVENKWKSYCTNEDIPLVSPLLVIQIEDGSENQISKTNISHIVSILKAHLGDISTQIAHCLQDDLNITLEDGFTIPKIEASKINDTQSLRVVLFKMALTTGWDCPRAEVMMSFRKANDSTLIAQLIGRMIRNPLAKRVETLEELNTVHLFLPFYDKDNVQSVVDVLTSDQDSVPVTSVKLKKDLIQLKIDNQFQPVLNHLRTLPTYVLSGLRKLPDHKRLIRFCIFISLNDEIDTGLLSATRNQLVQKLIALKDEYEERNDDFRKNINSMSFITIKPLLINNQTMDITEGEVQNVPINSKNIEDLFRVAKQRLGDDICISYLKTRLQNGDEVERIKLELFCLLQDKQVWNSFQDFCNEMLAALKVRHMAKINTLSVPKRAKYEQVLSRGRSPESILMNPPDSLIVSRPKDLSFAFDKHLYVADDGLVRFSFGSWEKSLLDHDLPGCYAWLRNIPRKSWSLCYPYFSKGSFLAGYPDFILVQKNGDGFVVNISEPHSPDLADAWAKAKGLALFANKHGISFGKIEISRVLDSGKIERLDFQNSRIRDRAMSLNNGEELLALYRDFN